MNKRIRNLGIPAMAALLMTSLTIMVGPTLSAEDDGHIDGVVTSASGPEAGVWVIAETRDFETSFRKIVVTDERGRFLVPELPDASYRVWVRGYGLVDSTKTPARPGDTLV